MKIREILKESTELDDSAGELKKAKNAISAALEGAILYRGADLGSYAKQVGSLPGGYALYYAAARSQKRDSLTGTNFFRDLVDESPAWRDVPSRSMSTFAATDSSTVAEFGDIQIILPLDSVKTFANIPHDFNMLRFSIKGKQKLSTGNFMTDISSLTTRSVSMLECIQFILKQPTLEKLQLAKSHSLWHELRVAAEFLKSESDFQQVKGELSNSDLLKVLKDNAASLVLNSKQATINEAKIDAVGVVAKVAAKATENVSTLFRKFLEALDHEISLIYRSEYFLNMIGDFEGSLSDTLKKELTPEKMGVTLHSSVKSALETSNSLSEVWFEGPYFMVSRGKFKPGRSSDDEIRPQDYFKDPDVREFFKRI